MSWLRPLLPALALLPGLLFVRPSWAIKCPNLQIVLDRSNSMWEMVGQKTRWQVARTAIGAVLDAYGGKVPIGLTLFPRGECDIEAPLPPTLSSKSAITKALDEKQPGGGTPANVAVLTTARLMQLRAPDRRQYMILITDGLPECNEDPQYSIPNTVLAIASALEQTPPIPTFVVGFGDASDKSLTAGLTRMAEAGGRPAPTEEKFYRADDADGLNLALSKILTAVRDEFGGRLCDESCKVNGCPDGGVCLQDECMKNPCAGIDCGPGLYCYTDGTSPGACRKPCLALCPAGTRCSMGACIADPCGNVCLPGTLCNTGQRRCEPDPQCKGADAPLCEAPADCQGGRCALDSCLFVRCPPGSDCVPWDGSCAANADTVPQTERMPRGCAALPGHGGEAGGAGLLLLSGLLLLPRRRRGSADQVG